MENVQRGKTWEWRWLLPWKAWASLQAYEKERAQILEAHYGVEGWKEEKRRYNFAGAAFAVTSFAAIFLFFFLLNEVADITGFNAWLDGVFGLD